MRFFEGVVTRNAAGRDPARDHVGFRAALHARDVPARPADRRRRWSTHTHETRGGPVSRSRATGSRSRLAADAYACLLLDEEVTASSRAIRAPGVTAAASGTPRSDDARPGRSAFGSSMHSSTRASCNVRPRTSVELACSEHRDAGWQLAALPTVLIRLRRRFHLRCRSRVDSTSGRLEQS